jgi:archaellum biogenesis protein FlaJ (TadC family)
LKLIAPVTAAAALLLAALLVPASNADTAYSSERLVSFFGREATLALCLMLLAAAAVVLWRSKPDTTQRPLRIAVGALLSAGIAACAVMAFASVALMLHSPLGQIAMDATRSTSPVMPILALAVCPLVLRRLVR